MNTEDAFTNEALFGRGPSYPASRFAQEAEYQPEEEHGYEWEASSGSPAHPSLSANALGARILWPALGFPAVIAPRQGASSAPSSADARHSICVLVLTARPLTPDDAARFLRYVPWNERHQRSIPAGSPGSFSAQELFIRRVASLGGQDDGKLCQAFSFGGDASNSILVSISNYVLAKYAAWGLTHLTEIRVSEAACQRLAAGKQYNLFWDSGQRGSASTEMQLLLEKFARPKQQKYGQAWQSWNSTYILEYGYEYNVRNAPYNKDDNKSRPVEVYHPVFVHRASGSTVKIGHVTDTHVSTRADIFERNLQSNGLHLPNDPKKIEFNNWNKSFETIYDEVKSNSEIVLLTGDLIDYGRGHVAQAISGRDLGQDGNYHEDRNWFLFYYLLAGHDPKTNNSRYTAPVYTTLGNHDWRLNPYPPFAPGSEDPAAFVHNAEIFKSGQQLNEIMKGAHLDGWEKEFSYILDVNKHVAGRIDKIPLLKQAAAAFRTAKAAAKVGIRGTGQALWGLLVTHNLNIKGTPLETTPESIAWYLLLINPFLDYQFAVPGGHQFLMLDWAQQEEVKNTPDGQSVGVRAAKCLTSLQRWHVTKFLAAPGKAKTIGIHMPPIGPRGEWTNHETADGSKSYMDGPVPMVAWDKPKRYPKLPLLAIAPPGFYEWLAASYGSFLRHRPWFIENLARTNHGVRLVFSGHIHRRDLLTVRPVTLQVQKNGWPKPEEHRLLKVIAVSPAAIAQGTINGPLYVNSTSAGPRGVQNFGAGEAHVPPGYTLVHLGIDGTIQLVSQRQLTPTDWRATPANQSHRELEDIELAEELEDALLGV